jgi:hypothetical protein
MTVDVYAAAAVMIECPRSRSLVPTGLHVLSIDELTSTSLVLDCPDCGRDHSWGPADAVLLPGPGSEALLRRQEISIGTLPHPVPRTGTQLAGISERAR